MEEKKKYDLEDRTLKFLKDVITFLRISKHDFINLELGKQLVRSAGSVGANYREANDSVSKRDFLFRIKICRKEAKESMYWLSAFDCNDKNEKMRTTLQQEARELSNIFGAIVRKSESLE